MLSLPKMKKPGTYPGGLFFSLVRELIFERPKRNTVPEILSHPVGGLAAESGRKWQKVEAKSFLRKK